jgi:hypothetical protein
MRDGSQAPAEIDSANTDLSPSLRARCDRASHDDGNLPLGVSHAVQPRSDRAVGASKTVPEAGLVDALEVRKRAAVSVGRHAHCAQIAAFGARSP